MFHDLVLYTPMYVTLIGALLFFFSNRKDSTAKLMLGIFMFDTFLLFLSHAFFYNNLRDLYIYIDVLFIASSLTVYPLYFWYIKLLAVDSKIKLKDYRILLPMLGVLFLSVITYLLMSSEQRQLYVNEYLFAGKKPNNGHILIRLQIALSYALQIIYCSQILFSLFYVRKYILKFNENLASFYSNTENRMLKWPLKVFYSFVIISVISIVFNFLGRSYFIESSLILLIPSASYTILLFILGYLGFIQQYSVVDFEVELAKNAAQGISISYNQERLKNKLLELFENKKIYKNPDLKITDVAQNLNTNRTYISNIINNDFSCSFSTFVNNYRIEEAKNLLKNKRNNDYSLDHISDTVGFGTLHTFIRAFNNAEGLTPGKFRDSIKN